ncbi:hypothetical protein QTN47_25100 [Danxiaibacter flavus]|uniref:DUF4175 family protein n=1 Tax=Danxiaibacter flavus TaxID=3049108 RepID=A0ABV3ZMU5_9BACT|nr:hypothetical protein QNM32_25105 [Chitinophagaceae bacterium DXS]
MSRAVNHIIPSLQKRWKASGLILNAFISLTIAVVIIAIVFVFKHLSLWWLLPAWIACFAGSLFLHRKWQVSETDVVVHLNTIYPQLEASVNLLLKPENERNVLENFQVEKLNSALGNVDIKNPFLKKIRSAIVALIAALIAFFLIVYIKPLRPGAKVNHTIKNQPAEGERSLPAIRDVHVMITPPSYTKKANTNQASWNIVAEQNAAVEWNIKTNLPVEKVQLIFDDSAVFNLSSAVNDKLTWKGSKTITRPGFYQVKLNGQLSDLYKIEMVKDQPPVIVVKSPKPSTVIDYGEPAKIEVNASITDDYGIQQRYIMATVASGSGEAVKFKEQKIGLQYVSGAKANDIKLPVTLPSLGMQPGDELYFYIAATDNNNQESRSDVYIITLADTAQLMSLDITINASDVKPEFFRSERQIIIETEQLLRERDTISETAFKNRSNDLGIDQKLLRLRYGKFLGEESEGNIGEAHDDHDEHDHAETGQFGNAAEILDQFSHKHDIAEDATFFDPETKKQLKATLAEMWNAELRLRTFKPAEALPFAYKALRLLKDLQQKSRVYVGKTNIKTPPLQKEKRLSGDLSGIASPELQRNNEKLVSEADVFKESLGVLEQLKTDLVVSTGELELLLRASAGLSRHAASNPTGFMHALQSMKNITISLETGKAISNNDIVVVQKTLYEIIPAPARRPRQAGKGADFSLSDTYFNNLQKQQH